MTDFGLSVRNASEMIALRGVDVSARTAGLLAETTVTQQYRNDIDANLELAYTFPLPVGGMLLSFAARIGERRYEGTVIQRQEAEVKYEEAISEGNSAFRLQEVRAGIYSATLGNVMAGEAVEITLTYAETLAWSGSSIRYHLPTTLAPRYGEPSGMQPWQRPVATIAVDYPLSVVVHIDGQLARAAISCPSHQVSFRPGAESVAISLAAGATLDRDFILEIANDEVRSLGISATACGTHIAMLTLLPPAVTPDTNTDKARDVVILLDCSGSMSGDSLTLAKEGVRLALDSLSPNERFGVIGFGSHFVQFDKTLQPANRKNLNLAHKFVVGLNDLGGTELSSAFRCAIGYGSEQPMDILVLTDGEVWGLDDAATDAAARGIRIFTVGIGSAVAEDTVRALADQTGGACELVSPNEGMSARIVRHFKRMRQPQVSRLDIRWPGEPLWESRPEKACFAGDAFTVAAAFAAMVTTEVGVEFEFAGQAAVALSVPLVPAADVADSVVRVAAKQHLAQLPAAEQQDWAVRYQLITAQTDCLVTVERAANEKTGALPELQVVPQMLAAGWGGSSSVRSGGMIDYCSMSYDVDGLALDLEAPATTCAKSISYSQMAASDDLIDLPEVPSVLRRGSRSTLAERSGDQNGEYRHFLRKLKTHTTRKVFGSLPGSRKALVRLDVPLAILSLLDELIVEGFGETDVVLALYQALAEHASNEMLEEPFIKRVEAATVSKAADPALVERFRVLLDALWANDNNSRYDIPAFLRTHVH